MTSRHADTQAPPREVEAALNEDSRKRLERDWELPMSERLARMHELCKQMTAIAGAAKPQ